MPMCDIDGAGRITQALARQFQGEAGDLTLVLSAGLRADSFAYEEIELAPEVKDDIILMAFEERVMLPLKSRRGSAWEDRILNFSEGERYQLPRVVRCLALEASRSGRWDIGYALSEVLTEVGERQVDTMVKYLRRLMERVPAFEMEVGTLQSVGEQMGLQMDMHDTLDRLVRCGVMSPRTQLSLHTGVSRFEINPCLYWRA